MNTQSISASNARLFYIYTGSWRDNAAGIKVMHFLCDALNRSGHEAFLVIGNHKNGKFILNPKLNTPILTSKVSRLHYLERKKPRVVYSETIVGNPLRASCVVRFFLNYPGTLGGNLKFPSTEMHVAYTQNIKKQLIKNSTVLFLPAVDLEELPKEKYVKEDFHLYYVGKFKAFIGNPNLPSTLKMREVSRIGSKGDTRNDLLMSLAKARSLFLFENSTLATEAILLGTPVVFIENPFLGEVIAEEELGKDGTTKGYSEEGILEAIGTLSIAKANYLKAQKDFWIQLSEFISDSDEFFLDSNIFPVTKIRFPSRIFSTLSHKIGLFIGVSRNYGVLKALRVSLLLNISFLNRNKK